jgi:hypothetical protein
MTTTELIAATRKALDVTAVEPFDMAKQIGQLKYLAEELCIELEDATDPDGRAARMMQRSAELGLKLDALAAKRVSA